MLVIKSPHIDIVTGARYERPVYKKVMHQYCH